MDSTNAFTTLSAGGTTLSSGSSRKRVRNDRVEQSNITIASMQRRTIDLSNASFGDGSTTIASSRVNDDPGISMDLGHTDDKRLQANTLGNRSIPSQAQRRISRAKESLLDRSNALSDVYTQEDLFGILQQSTDCCDKSEVYGGCIRKAFSLGPIVADGTVDFDLFGALNFIRDARAQRGKLKGDRFDSFVQEKVRDVISGEKVQTNGELRFEKNWKFCGRELCRQSYGLIFDISKHKLDACCAELKKSDTRQVTSISMSKWKDDHLHDYSFAQTEAIIKENLNSGIVEEAWCSAALTPTAIAQQFASVWLQRYFVKFGDRAPNRLETDLLIMAKRNVYDQYCREMTKLNQKCISKSVFITLWNSVFPRYINRPWCDIPGKCQTCFEIDWLRRTCQDDATLEQLKRAHHMHRGGLFMLERLE